MAIEEPPGILRLRSLAAAPPDAADAALIVYEGYLMSNCRVSAARALKQAQKISSDFVFYAKQSLNTILADPRCWSS